MWDKITNFLGGSLFGEIKDGIMSYFPPDLTPQERNEMELALGKLLAEKQREANSVLAEAQASFDQRIRDLEGTASDLKTIPILGPIIIFLRGVQRPAWGFYTAYLDFMWFSTQSQVVDSVVIPAFTEKQELGLILINVLVLGFLFGERTVKNLQPLIEKIFSK